MGSSQHFVQKPKPFEHKYRLFVVWNLFECFLIQSKTMRQFHLDYVFIRTSWYLKWMINKQKYPQIKKVSTIFGVS